VGAAARRPPGRLVAGRRSERVGQVLAQPGLLLVFVEKRLVFLTEGAPGQVGEAAGDPLGQQARGAATKGAPTKGARKK